MLPQNGTAIIGFKYHTREIFKGISTIFETEILLSTAWIWILYEPISCAVCEISEEFLSGDHSKIFLSEILTNLDLNLIWLPIGYKPVGLSLYGIYHLTFHVLVHRLNHLKLNQF